MEMERHDNKDDTILYMRDIDNQSRYKNPHYNKKKARPSWVTTNILVLVLELKSSFPFWPFGVFLGGFFFLKYFPAVLNVLFGVTFAWPVITAGVFSASFTLFTAIFSFMLLKNINKYGDGLRVYKDTCNEVATFSASMMGENVDFKTKETLNKLFCAYLTAIKLSLRGDQIQLNLLDLSEEMKMEIATYSYKRYLFMGRFKKNDTGGVRRFDSLKVSGGRKQRNTKNDIILEAIFGVLKLWISKKIFRDNVYPLGHHLMAHVHAVNSNLTKMAHNMNSKIPPQLSSVVVVAMLVFVIPIIQLLDDFNVVVALVVSTFLFLIFWGTYAVADKFKTPFVKPSKNRYVARGETISDLTASALALSDLHTYNNK